LQVCFGFVQLCGELTAGEDGLGDADGSNAITADIAWVSADFSLDSWARTEGCVSMAN